MIRMKITAYKSILSLLYNNLYHINRLLGNLGHNIQCIFISRKRVKCVNILLSKNIFTTLLKNRRKSYGMSKFYKIYIQCRVE